MARSSSIYSVNILGKVNKKNELILTLNELHKNLSVLSQDSNDRPLELTNLSLELISPKILNHNDREVRLISCCCIVDVLRVFAPEAPYSDSDMIRVFEVLINQIGGIATIDATSPTMTKTSYILSSLANVKSCVVPVILSQSGVKAADELVQSLFSCLISSVRAEHSDEVVSYCCSILQSCIEEFENFAGYQEILECLLQPLLPAAKAENAAAYRLCGTVLRRVAATIQAPISTFINKILLDSDDNEEGGTELEQHVYFIIFELHKIAPSLLTRIIPTICQHMAIESETARLQCVKLMGKLFSSQLADYAQEFSRGFREFLGRWKDKSVAVRAEVVDCCAAILTKKPTLRKNIEEPLVFLLRDAEGEIRLSVLEKLLEVVLMDPHVLSDKSIEEIKERATDKRFEIRRTVLLGLAKIYNKYISLSLPPLSAVYTQDKDRGKDKGERGLLDNVDEILLNRFQFVPETIIKSWGVRDIVSRHLVIQIVQEWLLPKSLPEKADGKAISDKAAVDKLNEVRASALLLLFLQLDISDRDAFASILTFKSLVRKELKSFLDVRSSYFSEKRAKGGTAPPFLGSPSVEQAAAATEQERLNLLRKPFYNLLNYVPATDKKSSLFDKLHSIKDKAVFGLLSRCVEPTRGIADLMTSREELKRKVDSKSALGDYLSQVFDIASFAIDNASVVFSLVKNLCEQDPISGRDSQDLALLLHKLAKPSPRSFLFALGPVSEWLDVAIETKDVKGKTKAKLRTLQQLQVQHSIAVMKEMATELMTLEAADDAQIQRVSNLIEAVAKHMKTQDDPSTCANLAEILALIAYQRCSLKRLEDIRQMAVDAITGFLKHFSMKKGHSMSNPRMECELAIFSNLVLPSKYLSILKSLIVFTTFSLECSPKIVHFITEHLLNNENFANGSSKQCTIVAGVKAMTTFLVSEEEFNQMRSKLISIPEYKAVFLSDQEGRSGSLKSKKSDASVEGNEVATASTSSSSAGQASEQFVSLMRILFNCIQTQGEELHSIVVPNKQSADKEAFLQLSSCCAMTMIKLVNFAKLISVDEWHQLAWTLLNPSPSRRAEIWAVLSGIIQTYPVHSKFLAYPCLLASDEALSAGAGAALQKAISRLRNTHEEMCARLVKADSERSRKMAEQCIPEAVLPYVLHLLSYHPDFPTTPECESESDQRRLKAVMRSIRIVITALQASLRNEASNISYLLKQLNLISQFYNDKMDAENIGLHFVAGVARTMLQDQVKTAENVQVYPGEITLPGDLFELKPEPDEEQASAREELEARTAVAEIQPMIDKAIQKAGKQRVKALPKYMSPPSSKLGFKAAVHRSGGSNSNRSVTSSVESRRSKYEEEKDHDADSSIAGRGMDEDDEEISIKKPRGKKAKAKKEAARPLPEEVKTRSLPSRRAKAVVASYKEAEVSEKEVIGWDEEAGEAKGARKRSFGKEEERSDSSAVKSSAFDSMKKVANYNIKEMLEPIPTSLMTLSAQKTVEQSARKSHVDLSRERSSAGIGISGSGDLARRRESELDLEIAEDDEFVAFDNRLSRDSAEWDSMLGQAAEMKPLQHTTKSRTSSAAPLPLKAPKARSSKQPLVPTEVPPATKDDAKANPLTKRRKFGGAAAENHMSDVELGQVESLAKDPIGKRKIGESIDRIDSHIDKKSRKDDKTDSVPVVAKVGRGRTKPTPVIHDREPSVAAKKTRRMPR